MSKQSKEQLDLLPGETRHRYKDEIIAVKCAHCGTEFNEGHMACLCRAIGNRKSACTYECNKALGQTI